MLAVPLYIIAAALVASLGGTRKKKNGFWWFFVISLVFTPVVGMIVIMATDPIDRSDTDKK